MNVGHVVEDAPGSKLWTRETRCDWSGCHITQHVHFSSAMLSLIRSQSSPMVAKDDDSDRVSFHS